MFLSDDDCQIYLNWLEAYAKESGCVIHAYVLMTNHAHLLMTPSTSSAASKMMKRLGQHYVQREKMGSDPYSDVCCSSK
ncbi:transposase [endosymbiont of Ridgeia piscesae]|uniref:transposase n=1 Tax=endosymbiont of Ridgeia piscesae TaxID=54398 RepID=UPI0009E71EFD|nr:transposase [endosymbiont of Ridgeia piscesae]